MIEKLDLTSQNITDHQKAKLKELFPEIITENNKIDWERLKLTLGEDIDVGKERFGFNWPGKADCFKTIQRSSIATLIPDRKESVNFETSENLFLEGDNLEILKLLQKSYLGKIKCIYIDPPYNTGKEFIYPDNFTESLNTYLQYTGQVDAEGRKFSTNAETDGRFHSKWLNMMYPRLFLAKNLLRDDGVIFISIDDHEVHHLLALCNEIFGEENFVNTITWEKRYSPQNAVQWFSEAHDFILIYAKMKEIWQPNLLDRSEEMNARYRNLDNDPRGDWKPTDATAQAGHGTTLQFYELIAPNGQTFQPPTGRCWVYTNDRMQEMIVDNRVWFGSDGKSAPSIKRFLTEVKQGVACQTIWKYEDVGHNQEGKKEIKILFPEAVPFDTPKPTRLINRILKLCTCIDSNDIILDFFAGSCTTAHAVLDLNKEDGGNRKFICVQLPEPCAPDSEAFKAGYKTIADIGKERIRRVIQKMNQEQQSKPAGLFDNPMQSQDLGFKVFKLSPSNFKIWNANVPKTTEAIEEQLTLHEYNLNELVTPEAMLYELLLKSGYKLSEPIKTMTLFDKIVYSIEDNTMLICLDGQLTQDLIRAMINLNPSRIVCLDKGFQHNDQLKTNAAYMMKSKDIAFRTV